jgi:hypothetical protein
MPVVELFAGGLFVALIAADWWRFRRPTASAVRYGCPVARAEEVVSVESGLGPSARFDSEGLLQLDHGDARWFPGDHRILLRPRSGRGAARFRTAWPLKGVIELEEAGGQARLRCVKLMPWSSAVLTLLWFAVVGVGTLAFVVRFLAGDDAFSLGSLLLILGVCGVGLLVFVFGLVTVSLAYRLEDQRLMQAYQELRAVLAGEGASFQPDMKSDKN